VNSTFVIFFFIERKVLLMSQTESAPETPPDPSNTETATKPSRHPVERLFVWAVIAIGVVVVGIEARARFGYNQTFSSISDKLKEVDESQDPNAALSLDEALKLVALSPKMSDVEKIPPPSMGVPAVWHKKLKWFSLAKEYEITLVMDGDDDGKQTVIGIETPNPPEEDTTKPAPASEGDEELLAGASTMGGGGGGGPPDHGEAGGGPAGGGGGGGGRGFGRPQGIDGLIAVEEVQAEIKLDEEQAKKVAGLAETLQAESAGIREIFGQMREAEESEREKLREQITTLRAGIEAKAKEALKEILNEEQMTRLQQIAWQQSRQSPLLSEEVAALIGLSEEQQTQLKSLSDELNAAMQDAERTERGAIRESYDEKFLAVLTEEQQTKWKSLLGEPFEMPAPSFGGGPGGGGPGGGPGGARPGGAGPGGGGNSERPQRPQRPE